MTDPRPRRLRPLALCDFPGPDAAYRAASERYGYSNDSWVERSAYYTARDAAWEAAARQAAALLDAAFGIVR